MPEEKDFVSGHDAPEHSVASAIVPDHELIRLIGKGGYGEVWLAKNTLGTFRAVKIVYEKTFEEKRPFEREFKGVQKFEPISRLHEGLMDVLQVGRNDKDGYFYCVMELADDVVHGQVIEPENYLPRTLAYDLKKHKRLSVPECARLGVAISSALDFLHKRGLIHRDVKPSNIVFVNGAPKLADIGLVAEASEAKSYVGTEGFIPPEGPGAVQADIYSLGKVLYELSTGKDRHDYPELPAQLGDGTQVDELLAFSRIFLKACRADARRRYRSAGAMVEDLLVLLDGKRTRFRTFARHYLTRAVEVSLVLAVVAGICLVGFGGKTGRNTKETPVGLISWWRGENSAADFLGENHGKIAGTGSVSYGPGVIGQAFVFDGIHRDRIDLGNPTNLQLQDFTIEAWIKRANPTNISLDDSGEDGSIVGGGGVLLGYGTAGYGLAVTDNGRLMLSRMDFDAAICSNAVTDTDWHHVAVTKSQSNVVFYIDGEMASDPIVYDTWFSFETPVAIGSRGDGYGATFWGAIDELTICDRILSASEIEAIYKAGSDGKNLSGLRPLVLPLPGLVDRWSADGHARSISGKHDGDLVNGVTFTEGKLGKAFCFNGRNQYVKIPRSSDLDVGNQVTIACWIKADPANPLNIWQGLVATDFYAVNIGSGFEAYRMGVVLGVCTDGGKFFSSKSWPTTGDVNGGGAVINAGEWYHVAGTYDGAVLQLYMNGRAWGKPVAHTGVISPMRTNTFMTFGSEEGAPWERRNGRYFKGLMDEICLFNRALSADEIEHVFNTGRTGISVTSSR